VKLFYLLVLACSLFAFELGIALPYLISAQSTELVAFGFALFVLSIWVYYKLVLIIKKEIEKCTQKKSLS